MTVPSDLRALAEKATPGPWHARGVSIRQTKDDVIGGIPLASVYDNEADAEFIAACDPTTIVALLDRLAPLQHVADTAREHVHSWDSESPCPLCAALAAVGQ